MRSSDEVDKIAPAWVTALSELDEVAKSKRADMGTYSYTYVDINAVLRYMKPVLANMGLAVSQACAVTEPGSVIVTTRVWHSSGQWIEDDGLRLPCPNDPQKIGGAITYARRYALTAFLGLETPDDDGGAATVELQREMDEADERRRRARTVLDQLTALDDEGRSDFKAWADGKGFAIPDLEADEAWCTQIEEWVMARG